MPNKKEVIKAISLTFGTLAFVFLISYLVFAWQEPTSAPPFGNVPAPLNIGTSTQTKLGPLVLNQAGISPTGLIVNRDAVFTGNIAIGTTTSPNEALEVSGNIKNEGIILQPLSSLPTCDSTLKGRMVYYNDKFQYCNGSFWKELERVTGYTRVRTCIEPGCSDWCDIGTDCSSYPCLSGSGECPEGYGGSARPVVYTYKGSNRIESYVACYSGPNCTGAAIRAVSDETYLAGAPSLQHIDNLSKVLVYVNTTQASVSVNLDFNSKIAECGYDPKKVRYLEIVIEKYCDPSENCTEHFNYEIYKDGDDYFYELTSERAEGLTNLYVKQFPFQSDSSYTLEVSGIAGSTKKAEVVLRGIWIEQ